MKNERIEHILDETGARLRGHFLLTSGLHSHTYLQCARVMQYPDHTEALAQALAQAFADMSIDLVVGPALGGVILAYEVARALRVRNLFAEREQGKMQLRRGFTVTPGENILVTEDVVTTGGSVKEVIALLEDMGAHVVGVGSIIDRSGGQVAFGRPFRALLTLQVEAFTPDKCPQCAQNIPVVKPGSRLIQN